MHCGLPHGSKLPVKVPSGGGAGCWYVCTYGFVPCGINVRDLKKTHDTSFFYPIPLGVALRLRRGKARGTPGLCGISSFDPHSRVAFSPPCPGDVQSLRGPFSRMLPPESIHGSNHAP